MTNEAELVAAAMVKLAIIKRERAAAAAQRPVPSPTPTFDGLHEAAAVLGWFDANELQPTEPVPAGARDLLIASAITVLDDRGGRRLSLPADVRIPVLRQLRERGTVDQVLADSRGEPGDTLHRLLRHYLTTPDSPPNELSLSELQSTALVCGWLRSAGFTRLPDADALSRRTAWLTLLEPFEHLAGKNFRGRTAELARLRAYAGVLPPGGADVQPAVSNASPRMVPLMIYGPGGVGKSTLVARFILEHARALERDRFPFVYLDFDRPDVDPAEPLTLLIEALRQLTVEYPVIGSRADRIREDWIEALHEPDGTIRARSAAAADFKRLLASVGASDRPAVFVLDTFEEAQWRSQEYVQQILKVLADVGRYVPRFRLIIAGRGEIPDVAVNPLLLTGLDREAAVGFLMAHGISDPYAAARIATKVGGDPQNLKLATRDYLATRPGGGSALDRFLDQLDEGMTREKLHNRVLGHIHDENVKKLANPGLVLRRLTADLILEVLAGPCELSITRSFEAQLIFEELRKETALVKIDSDGALIHLPELRKSILTLLEKAEPKRSEQIHRGAVSFYAGRTPSPVERAEEIYHRLKLDQDRTVIIDRWLPGVESRLINAVDEFGDARHAFLAAKLGLAVSDQVRQAAAQPDWECLVAPRVRTLIDNGESAAALVLTEERSDRLPASALVFLEAEALVTLNQAGKARAVLEAAASRSEAAGLPNVTYSVLRFEAEIMVVGQHGDWEPLIERTARLAAASDQPVHRLLAAAVRRAAVVLVRSAQEFGPQALRAAFDAVEDVTLSTNPQLAALVGAQFRDPEDAPRLRRVLTLIGNPEYDPAMLRRLAGEIAQFDRSRDFEISRRYGLGQRATGTEAWGEHLIAAPVEESTATILALCDDYGSQLPEAVITAGAAVLLTALPPWNWYPAIDPERTPPPPGDEPPSSDTAVLSQRERQNLSNSISRIFTKDTLRTFLRSALTISLDSIVPGGAGLIQASLVVADQLAREGKVTKFVADAREVAPSDAGLLEIARELGLATLAAEGQAEQLLSGSGMTGEQLRERLGLIEGQVCRIEGDPFGAYRTGFLIGDSLVLTAGLGRTDTFAYQCRFDLKSTTAGLVISGGQLFTVRDVLASDPLDELGFALLWVEGSPGVQPVGGSASISEVPRGWLQVGSVPSPGPDDTLCMAHYPGSEPLKLSVRDHAVAGYSDDRTRLFNRFDAESGSAGAPIFDAQLRPVAVQLGRHPDGTGFAVPLRAIESHLIERGLGYLFGTTLA